MERTFDASEYAVMEKRKRCGKCAGCLAENCGECAMCLDMPKYGGKGTKRQTCERRVCEVLFAEWAEREVERTAQLEEVRQQRAHQRETERQARIERQEEERQQKVEAREAARLAREQEKAERLAMRAAAGGRSGGRGRGGRGRGRGRGESRVIDHPQELTAFGWGVHAASALPEGTAVEVLGLDEGLRGACFAAQVTCVSEADLRARPTAADAEASPAVSVAAAHAAAAAEAEAAAMAAAEAATADPSDAAVAATAAAAAEASAATSAIASASASFASAASAARGYVMLEYLDLLETDDEDSPLLREWVACGGVRPAPPACPAGFHGLLRPGDRAQLLLDEAYWDVQVDEVLGADPNTPSQRQFVVSSLQYAATHVVGAEQIRPLWRWAGAVEGGSMRTAAWRYEILAGSGIVDCAEVNAVARAVFLFADGVQRRHSPYFHAVQRGSAATAAATAAAAAAAAAQAAASSSAVHP